MKKDILRLAEDCGVTVALWDRPTVFVPSRKLALVQRGRQQELDLCRLLHRHLRKTLEAGDIYLTTSTA